jgi:hypothetical protein
LYECRVNQDGLLRVDGPTDKIRKKLFSERIGHK